MAKSQVNRNKHGRIASKPGKVQVKVKRKSASLKNQMRSCQRLLKQVHSSILFFINKPTVEACLPSSTKLFWTFLTRLTWTTRAERHRKTSCYG